MEEIIKEKISADHLLYVSLKYTKTCDVIINLLARWKSLIGISFDGLLEQALEKKKIPNLPTNPKQKIEFVEWLGLLYLDFDNSGTEYSEITTNEILEKLESYKKK